MDGPPWSQAQSFPAMKLLFSLFLLSIFVASDGKTLKTKPLCGLCLNMVQQLDSVLEHGGDIEKAVDTFCKEDVPSFLVNMCEKVIEKNLEEIIEKLKQHEPAEKICGEIYLCKTDKEQ